MYADSTDPTLGLGFGQFFPTGAAGEEDRLVSDAVASHVASLIENGTLERGDRIPPERDLVGRLGVSRSAVREGLRTLEALGVLEAHVGRGRFVVGAVASASGTSLVREWLELHQGEMSELTEIRELLEGSAIRSVPGHDVAGVAVKLRAALAQGKTAWEQGDIATVVKADFEFHRVPLDRAGNQALGALTIAVLKATQPTALAVLSVKDAASVSLGEHKQILGAFESGDLDRAAVLTGLHERSSFRRLLPGGIAAE